MLRLFQVLTLVLGLSLVALASAIITMRLAIHGSEVAIPNFKGLTAEEALSKAASLGVDMTIDNRFYSADVPAGRILAQTPVAGTVVRREWHVRATESLGPQTIQIPDIVRQSQRAASIQIRRSGLELASLAQMPSDADMAGTVIAQDPQAGAAGVEKPSISIVVGTAATEDQSGFVMPNFLGQPRASAAGMVERAGLKTEIVLVASAGNPASQTPGIVVDQKPAAGYKVSGQTPVTLTVSR